MRYVVIKCGGSVLNQLADHFFNSILELQNDGMSVILVHGGGPDINEMLTKFNVPTVFVGGLRKTTKDTLDIAEMVLSGITNRKLTKQLQEFGMKAVGINGSDAGLLIAERLDEEQLGFVGEVKRVNTQLLQTLCQNELLPVITPIAWSEQGTKLNVNADYAAAAIASSLGAEQCLFVTDVDGIMVDREVKDQLSKLEVQELITTNTIYGGMIPKVMSALKAIEAGLANVRIVNGSKMFYDKGRWIGTKICRMEGMVQ